MKLPDNLPMPDELSKDEIIDLLTLEEYGRLPTAQTKVWAEVVTKDDSFCAGKATLIKLMLKCQAPFGEFAFPVYYTRLNTKEKVPCFIHINFRDNVPDRYLPSEEIVDSGFSVLSFCYKDVSSDDGDFTNGLAGVVYKNGERKNDDCGKIGLWAWAAMRVMDYALTLPELDHSHISVVGHSRLGKTALLTGALDKRFFCAFSNDSGCSGAALARGKQGETIEKINNVFPHWFCKNYKKHSGNEDKMPFDQHFLLAANVPHLVYVASAMGDAWAHPENEYLSCVAASDYYVKHTGKGFIHPQCFPKVGEPLHQGNIGYHIREGEHYLSREDWQYFIKFLRGKM